MLLFSSMIRYEDARARALRNPEVRAAYDALEPEFAIIEKVIKARIQQGLTQAALAKKAGMHQSAIARFESGTSNPTWSSFLRIAEALSLKVQISPR
jgi:DNA-binding XRE family transcriptional regulator